MKGPVQSLLSIRGREAQSLWTFVLAFVLIGIAGCAPKQVMTDAAPAQEATPAREAAPAYSADMSTMAPSPDPRVGLGAGLFDAEEAIWNMNMVSTTPPTENFIGITNSDLAFLGDYVFQGNYNGIQIFDVSNPARPELVTEYVCPASQSDVSVYGNLMTVSGEGLGGRLDCGTEGVQEAVSHDRLRGLRIFNIEDVKNPVYVSNVQTCRGSHTHSLLKDPNDDENIYVYISGSSSVRPEEELAGCSGLAPSEDPNSALFRIEVIKIPLDSPEDAAIVSSPRIFENLVAPPVHGQSPADIKEIEEAKARGEFVVELFGQERVMPAGFVTQFLNGFMEGQGKGGEEATAADSAAFREALPAMIAARFGAPGGDDDDDGPAPGPTQCHDITLYPEIGRAGGACGGYGLMLDITDPANPVRMDAVADSNFSYWHSATFSNDGTKVLFTDEWGGGGQPKCREDDPMEWGANAYFSLAEDGKMDFTTYWKLPAPQTSLENCVAHNGSLIPIPGREIMVQSWYQGGISIFDWTDLNNPYEIAYHDRGPSDANSMGAGGSWSVYWYNGYIYSSEIARGLDVFELKPSGHISANEIEAANTVRLDYLNAQGQPKFVWPTTFALAGAYLDQMERAGSLSANVVSSTRESLNAAKSSSGSARSEALRGLARSLAGPVRGSNDPQKGRMLIGTIRRLIADS